jgi:hypothetical protein
MRPRHYILVDEAPTEADLETWARWFETNAAKRMVAKTTVSDTVQVSTVFLGLDHNHGDDGPPILWETMIFGGPHDQYQRRYSSRADAEAGHLDAVALAQGATRTE